MLAPEDFPLFFEEVYGYEPFPWQKRLLRHVADGGAWPSVLDLPTGSGKTAAIDIAVFHLALEADRGGARRAPVRVAFVVDRRLVVDDAFERAKKLEKALAGAQAGSVAARVAERLKLLSDDGLPLIARRLRGGVPRESDWVRTPAQPAVLCSTVDQVGSRLLFRGYGVSDSMKPVHAGLLGSDCLILLDEAHLAEPFRQTLDWVRMYRGEKWREADAHAAPSGVALLTATPGEAGDFSLSDKDRMHPILKARLEAPKRAHLVKAGQDGVTENEEDASRSGREFARRVEAILKEIQDARKHFANAENGASIPAIGVVVNRVARAREVHKRLCETLKEEIVAEKLTMPILMIGPQRPLDRDALVEKLAPIRTRTWKKDETRTLDKPLVLVATQCIEAGVDIDLDALITEAAPLDALRQRFGRLNRAGREIEPYAAIVAGRSDTLARQDDPIYKKAIKPAWDYLDQAAKANGGRVDFGVDSVQALMAKTPVPDGAWSPKEDAPILLPAHLDLLSQTWPIPAADPDIALYLHGPDRQPDAIAVVWRADIDPETHRDDDATRRLLTLVPPRSTETIELPIWAVRRWLAGDAKTLERLADVAAEGPEDEAPASAGRDVFRWKGDKEQSRWIRPSDIRPGDTIVVPARYGGLDECGWNPGVESPIADLDVDIGRDAAKPFAARRFAVRIAPGLLAKCRSGETPEEHAARERERAEALADALSTNTSARWREVRDALLALGLPEDLRRDLERLEHPRKGKVSVDLEVYGFDGEKRPRGAVFVATLGLKKQGLHEIEQEDEQPNATEDDVEGSLPGFRQELQAHCLAVEKKAKLFAKAAGLPEDRVRDLTLAGFLHDAGKSDRRFQAWLQYGDPLGPDPDKPNEVLAKSGRFLPPRAREASGLPQNWRHEAFSVRLALAPHARFAEADDPELVLWLMGVHHGRGRPFFPHADDEDGETRALPSVLDLPHELPAGCGPQSLAFDWNGLDWPSLFARLKARYGVWELARMEAILRLADHRASEEAAREESE
jgi:CRISPR-associated endonuclease/helicase Cas3